MDKEKIFLDLSKCTEEEQRKAINTLRNSGEKIGGTCEVRIFPYLYMNNGVWWQYVAVVGKQELTYPEFIKLFKGGESKEVLQVENNECIKSIAISHQKQMSSTHPHAIIGTIEDAIIEALETFKSNNQ